MKSSTEIAAVLNDLAASRWLKSALHEALARDAVDSANDAAVLARLLKDRVYDLAEVTIEHAREGCFDHQALNETLRDIARVANGALYARR